MNNRSYYTTPLLVVTTLISLYVFVAAHNTRAYIEDKTSNQLNEQLWNDFLIQQSYQGNTEIIVSVSHIEPPETVRAIYISSWVAGTPSIRNKLISFIETSKINAVVIDIKDSTGVISFPITSDSTIAAYDTDSDRIKDINELIKELHQKDIYIIGRLTTFQDPLLAKHKPEFAFKRIDNNQVWTDRKGLSFINPNNKDAWDYLARIAEYSYDIGFDEINFDYIRYPSDGNIDNINYAIPAGETRASMMKKFYEYMDTRLRDQEIPISADVFGLVTSAEDDLGIGQVFEDILPHFDYVAPMVYPSHYSSGFFGYNNPNAYPYEVVHAAMESGKNRALAMGEDPQKLRTWIQDFSLGINYGKNEITKQIQATYDVGLDSYMVWDPKNKYTQEAYY